MNETTARVARAFAQSRPETLEASTTRPHLSELEDQWASLAIAVDLELRHGGHDTEGFLTTDGIFGDRLAGELFTWEGKPAYQATI